MPYFKMRSSNTISEEFHWVLIINKHKLIHIDVKSNSRQVEGDNISTNKVFTSSIHFQ